MTARQGISATRRAPSGSGVSATAAALARYADLESWAFYNGLLAYALIGSLFALEWLLRRARCIGGAGGRP